MAFDAALGPDEGVLGLARAFEADIETGVPAVAEVDDAASGDISTAFGVFGNGSHGARLGVEPEPGGVDGVGADIPHGAASV